MAQKFLTSIDLNLNELQNAKLHVLSTVPTTGLVTGRMYFNSTNNLPYWYNGSSWVTFASATDFSTLSENVTTLKGYFTNGIANQAAKVTNALSFTAGTFSTLSSYDGSAARTLKIPTTTAHIAESDNLYFTNARAQAAITGGASSIVTSDLTASRALISDSSGKVAVSAVTSTELGYLDGVTSKIQTQLDALSTNLSNYLPLAGGTMTGTINFGSSSYGITNTGAATLASLTVSGTSTLKGNVTVTGNVLPSASATYNLGGSSNYWNYLYAKYGVIGSGGLKVNGTITATALRRYDGTTANTSALVQAVSNNTDITLFRVNYATSEAYSTTSSYGYSLFYKGSDAQNRLYLMADNSTATSQNIALCVFQTGVVGIRGEANSNYALTVNGKLYATGESLFDSTIIANGNIRLGAGKKLYGTKTDGSTAINLIEFTDTSMTINGAALATTSINSATTAVNALTATSITIGSVVIEEGDDGILKFYYKGDKDGTSNVATIYATGGVSALGLGAGSGGTGGGLIQTVYSSSDLSTSSDAFDDADLTSTFNAYTINLIDGKTTELGTQLTDLTSRVASLESYFSTAEDSDTTINKWNELVEFLDGVAETDNLASLLASKVGSVEVTGNGNVFTEASISGSKLTLTKGITFVDDTTLSTWTGSNKITTLGTITTGTWNGTKITNDYISSVAWNKLSGLPTTISGYGITDAYTKTEVNNLLVKRYSGTITGNASTTSFTITHSLNTTDVMVFTRDSSTTTTNGYQQVYCDIYIKDANNIIVTFASAPASGTTYRVTVLA